MRRTRNAKYGQPYRGFESLPLRHPIFSRLNPRPAGLAAPLNPCARLRAIANMRPEGWPSHGALGSDYLAAAVLALA